LRTEVDAGEVTEISIRAASISGSDEEQLESYPDASYILDSETDFHLFADLMNRESAGAPIRQFKVDVR
jgi:hypothetical protein